MSARAARLLSRSALFVGLTACTSALETLSDGGTSEPDAGVVDSVCLPENAQDELVRIAASRCQYYYRCFSDLESAIGRSETDCVETFIADSADQISVWDAAINSGRAAFKAGACEQCTHELEGADCERGTDPRGACEQLTVGTRAAGDPCFDSVECIPGEFCDRLQGPGSCGTCRDLVAIGEACDYRSTCELGAVCNSLELGVCRPANIPEGESCGGDLGFCRHGLECGSDSKCARFAGLGEPCHPFGESSPQCNLSLGHICVEGACRKIQYVGLGEACNDLDQSCDFHGFCDSTSSRCVPRNRLGESCTFRRRCEPNLYCENNVCRNLRAAGESCPIGLLVCAQGLSGIGPRESAVCGAYAWRACE